MHVYLGDGIAVVYFGEMMNNKPKKQNMDFSYTDTKIGTGYERCITFEKPQNLGMTVLLHTVLHNVVSNEKAIIYLVNADGTRTKITNYVFYENNSVCWTVDSTQKYVIAY